jgi:hypothetical protein
MMPFSRFPGNCPRLAPKDAKYAIRWRQGELVVSLIYRLDATERVYLSTDAHPQLVQMVNAVKQAATGESGGVFYINEWRQVIVPVRNDLDYYYVGEYSGELKFAFEGQILSGRPVDRNGNPLRPGDPWEGPHPGIPYKLRAGGRDIAYEVRIGPDRVQEVRLSLETSPEAAEVVARKIRAIRGELGGRFYVNEWRAMFTPVAEAGDLRYVYAGQLEETDPWFRKPEIPLAAPG